PLRPGSPIPNIHVVVAAVKSQRIGLPRASGAICPGNVRIISAAATRSDYKHEVGRTRSGVGDQGSTAVVDLELRIEQAAGRPREPKSNLSARGKIPERVK